MLVGFDVTYPFSDLDNKCFSIAAIVALIDKHLG